MTTPETRTAEQARAYDAWQDAKRKGVHVHELAAAIAFVRSCLPEPQASKASEGEGRQTDFTESEMRAAPAGEAVSVAREETAWLIEHQDHRPSEGGPHYFAGYNKHSLEWTQDVNKAVRFARKVDAEAVAGFGVPAPAHHVREHMWLDAAPPPSTGDEPAPTPPPAPAGDAEYAGNLLAVIHRDGGHYITEHGWIKAVDDAKAKWYDMLARAESVAPAPSTGGDKPPTTQAILDNAKVQELSKSLPPVSAPARVTPPQQEEDRAWEKECEVRQSIDFPGTWIVERYRGADRFLHPDRRWHTLSGPGQETRFPSESAAFSALAQAPRPTT